MDPGRNFFLQFLLDLFFLIVKRFQNSLGILLGNLLFSRLCLRLVLLLFLVLIFLLRILFLLILFLLILFLLILLLLILFLLIFVVFIFFIVVFLILFLLLLLSPLLGFVAVLIKIATPGPILFAQKRLGKGGVPFKMFKFRTMRTDAEEVLKSQDLDWVILRPSLVVGHSVYGGMALVRALAYRVMYDIARVSTVTPQALAASALLSFRGRGIPAAELGARVDALRIRWTDGTIEDAQVAGVDRTIDVTRQIH